VRDMWLTGFDAPSLHTMYIDKPMRGHGLMQAIARVNRVFRDKPGGLVVDYLGLAQELKQALATYTESGGTGRTALDQDEAVAVMLEKYEVCCGLFHGFDWSKWTTGTPQQRLGLLPLAQEHILAQENGKERCVGAVRELSQAFALAVPHSRGAAHPRRRGVLPGGTGRARQARARRFAARGRHRARRAADHLARGGAGGRDRHLRRGRARQARHLDSLRGVSWPKCAACRSATSRSNCWRSCCKGELATRRRKNVVQARSFAEMLEQTIRRYQNRAIEAAQVIEELIGLAREMREAHARGRALRLSEDELAFYDALETNDSAVKVLGDETLRTIAQELVKTVRANVTIDWTLRENVRAQLRVLVKRILRRYGYPPDKQEKATATVLEQAALLSAEWAAV
jgi:type I restriction enzyme R subunit